MTYTGIIDQKNLISLCNCPFNYFCPWYHKAGEGDEDQNISTILIEFFKRISAREIRITRSFFAYRPSGTIEEVKEMNKAVKIIQMLIRLVGLVLLVLGILFWTGQALNLKLLHIAFGLIFVLLLWGLTFLAAKRGISGSLLALGAIWGVVLPALGLTQERILPGPAHWVIDVVHLLVGVGAIGFGEYLAGWIMKKDQKTTQRPRSSSQAVSRAK